MIVTIFNKAIVDYTSHCALPSPLPPTMIGDVAYHRHARGGPSHGHRQYAQKLGKDYRGGSRYILSNRQTDRHTDRHTHHNTSQLLLRAK